MLCISATTTTMALLQLSGVFVAAYPVEKVVNVARGDAPVILGEHANHRTIVVVFCMCYAFLLALAQGMIIPSSAAVTRVVKTTQAIEQAAWLVRSRVLDSLICWSTLKASSAPHLSSLSESTAQALVFLQTSNATMRSEYALLCMRRRRPYCKSSMKRSTARLLMWCPDICSSSSVSTSFEHHSLTVSKTQYG